MSVLTERVEGTTGEPYRDNFEHLVDELRKLDLLLQLRVDAFRRQAESWRGPVADPQVYISHAEVDRLLGMDGSQAAETAGSTAIRRQLVQLQGEIACRLEAGRIQGIFLALPQLARLFRLSPFELQAVIICLAPELRRKYDRLYAYLQDDITRKRPSVDLMLDLLCEAEAERWAARTLFTPGARLRWSGILRAIDDPMSPSGSSGLAQFLALDPRILNYILGDNTPDARLNGLVTLFNPQPGVEEAHIDPSIKTELLNLIDHHFDGSGATGKKLVLHLQGPYGAGKRELALEVCARLRCPLLSLDVAALLAGPAHVESTLRLAYREGLLLQSALYLDNADSLLGEEPPAQAHLKQLSHAIAEYGWLTFLAGEKRWSPAGAFEGAVAHSFELTLPAVPLRAGAWQESLEHWLPGADGAWCVDLARQFRLTPGQIRDAVALARNWQAMRDGQGALALADLYAACRAQSNQRLGELAVKIEPVHGWDDIVLPEDKLAQLHEICDQVRYRHRVMGEWGFDRKLSHGKGLSALFTGPPGTGKTMAAEVMARELGLDLYKIDLSGVVSKYVGETEKNLARIFQEAETSNTVLFFDEADALFGRRTQISDAHDRYANIETSYLLQRMETYEGIVILATNLRQNLDEAFGRRIRFVVEFPFPNAASREAIWQTHFPQQAPLGDDVDPAWLARQFAIAGGDIRNIVLNAAFLASADGGTIEMAHLLRGTRREYEKLGKLWNGQDAPVRTGHGQREHHA